MNETNPQHLLKQLENYFFTYLDAGICIAYSGGVDSTLLLRAALNAALPQKKPVLALILETRLHPHKDTLEALSLARSLGAMCEVISIDEFQDPQIRQNPENRCYLCKRLLFRTLKERAAFLGFTVIADGTNADDLREYRPGLAALEELGVHSPLKELGITKQEVREISAFLGLSTASKPSTPCLATRLPYHTLLDYSVLERIQQGEELLRAMGFYNVRLRFHEPVLRIEVDTADFPKLLERTGEICAKLKALGFLYITLDLEGFRSGSMDIGLKL